MHRSVRIFDTTLRDGEQTPGVHLTPERKLEVARRLEALGVDTIEAGFPVSSPGEMEAVSRIAAEARSCEVAALARCAPGDVEAAARALAPAHRPVLHVFLGASDIHLERKLRITRAEALRRIERVVALARRVAPEVEFSPEDATRAERAFLRQCVLAAVEAGATRVNIPDTVGCATPSEYGALIRDVRQVVEGAALVSAHCHNDLGLATANTLAAIEAGADQVEVTVNGLGERAGNTALEEVAVACALKGLARTGLRLDGIAELSRRVADITGVVVQPNRPVVGGNAFAHSSGIHQDGILKDAANYEFVPPALVGAPGHRFVLTARSGRSAIAHQAAALGYALSSEEADAVYAAFVTEAESAQGAVSPEAVNALLRRVCGRPARPTGFPEGCRTDSPSACA